LQPLLQEIACRPPGNDPIPDEKHHQQQDNDRARPPHKARLDAPLGRGRLERQSASPAPVGGNQLRNQAGNQHLSAKGKTDDTQVAEGIIQALADRGIPNDGKKSSQ
jgi:hypothetical protein